VSPSSFKLLKPRARNTKSPYSRLAFPFGCLTYLTLAHREYLPELARVREQREATLQKQKEDSTARMLADLNVDRARNPNFAAQDQWNPDEEEQEDEDDGGELNIIDKSESISGVIVFPSAFRLSPRAECSRRHSGGLLYDTSRRGLFSVSPFG